MDSSAWIELLRATESPTDCRLTHALVANESLAITGSVMLEIFAGARDEAELGSLRSLLARCEFLAVSESVDYEVAADLYRACRREGETVRRPTDCLIAAISIRAEVPVLHRDSDFDVLARHTALMVAPT